MYVPVIIIGAPRSGTNMLRDALCRLEGFGSWPCDEINMIWRYGNSRWVSDVLPPDLATGPVQTFIRSCFDRRAAKGRVRFLVEKTCANSLRVPYVDRVIKEAKYIFIHRDSSDASVSAMRRWRAPFELMYTLNKLRLVPASDVSHYAARFLRNRTHRLFSSERRIASWGPRYPGLDDDLERYSLLEVCARQWAECVGRSVDALRGLPADRVHVVSYEDFVANPASRLAGIAEFLHTDFGIDALRAAVRPVNARSIGNAVKALDEEELASMLRLTSAGAVAAREFHDSVRGKVKK
jgi:hypothetical protein